MSTSTGTDAPETINCVKGKSIEYLRIRPVSEDFHGRRPFLMALNVQKSVIASPFLRGKRNKIKNYAEFRNTALKKV